MRQVETKGAVPLERIKQVAHALAAYYESYDAAYGEDYDPMEDEPPDWEWPDDPPDGSPEGVALSILKQVVNDDRDKIAVYDGYAGACCALLSLSRLAE